MTTIAPGNPAAPDPATPGSAVQSAWNRQRTTPDGDIMPGEDAPAGGSGMGFGDLLDVINPLQHLPVVGTIYRALTGDTISDAARMAGGALYGGPFGLIGALANVVVEREAGQDIGDSAMAWLSGGPEAGGEAGTALADASATQAQPINAAPVTITAANASPAALAANAAPAALAAKATPAALTANPAPPAQVSPAVLAAAAAPAKGPDADAPATTSFEGRNADRLDAFIQQANAVRRQNPLAPMHRQAEAGRTGSRFGTGHAGVDPTRLQNAALRPPTLAEHADSPLGKAAGARNRGSAGQQAASSDLALAGGDAGSVNDWMLRALDKYEHMQRQERS